MSDRHAISILLPDDVLPPEGAPPAKIRSDTAAQTPPPGALLEALTFALFTRKAALAAPDIEQTWRHAYLRLDAARPGRVWLDLTPGFYELDFNVYYPASGPAVAVSLDSPRQKQVAAMRRATRAFAGQAVPLLVPDAPEAGAGEGKGDAAAPPLLPLAIWLATAEQLEEYSREGVGSEELAPWIDEAEVSARGMREVALAAAIFVMGLRAAPPMDAAATGNVAVASATPGGGAAQTLAGDLQVLPVTSQHLHQAPPRVDWALLAANQGATSDPARVHIIVDVSAQRAYLLVDGRIAVDTPVSTGRPGHNTPRGTFSITEKVRDGKISTLYGSAMPYFMRLGDTAVGLHEERLPGQPASHGCVRLPLEAAKVLYEHTPSGATVEIVNAWTQQTLG